MNIKEKEKIFEESCQRLLQKEVSELNKTIDLEIEKQIKDELQEYQKKEEVMYNKKIDKLEKDYNKQIYNYEMESRKEVLNTKKEIQKDIKKQVQNLLKDFSKTTEYEEFLFSRIDESIRQLPNLQNANLYLTNEDFMKFGNKIKSKYNIKLDIIDDKYIGGCILEDSIAGLYIDNTIQNSINEKLDNN